jgi:hypothetical protein
MPNDVWRDVCHEPPTYQPDNDKTGHDGPSHTSLVETLGFLLVPVAHCLTPIAREFAQPILIFVSLARGKKQFRKRELRNIRALFPSLG